jgi:dipeptidyl-peptidase-4
VRNPEFLEQYAATYRFSLGRPANIQITRAGDAVLFLRSGPRSFVRELYEFDVASGKERVLATAEKLLGSAREELSDEEKARRERMRLAARGIATYNLSRDGRGVLVPLSGRLFVVDRATARASELRSSAGPAIDAQFSPDGKLVACVRDGDLYVVDAETGIETRLTEGASETLTHGLAEFVAQEEMGRMHGYWWSPDSRQIAYEESDTSEVETLHIADPAHPERPAQSWRYPRPDKNNASVRLGIIPITGGETSWVEWDRTAFPYLAAVTWEENAPLTVLVQNREQTLELLLAVDPATGATRELLREEDEAWVNLDAGLPRWLPTGKQFLWSSERSGQWQLELHAADGRLLGPVTSRELNYRHTLGVDETANSVYVAAGADPTQSHVYRKPLEPNEDRSPLAGEGRARAKTPLPLGEGSVRGNREQLTHEPGVSSAVVAAEAGTYVVTSQTLDSAPVSTVYRRDGTAVGALANVAETTSLAPRVELTTVGESPTMHAAIILPRDFQKGQEVSSDRQRVRRAALTNGGGRAVAIPARRLAGRAGLHRRLFGRTRYAGPRARLGTSDQR